MATVQQSETNRASILRSIVVLNATKHKWFGADNYFNTRYETGMLKGQYFIDSSMFIDSDGNKPFPPEYKVRFVSGRKIHTLNDHTSFASLDDAKAYINDHHLTLHSGDRVGEYIVLTESSVSASFKLHAEAFEHCEGLECNLCKAVYRIVKKGILGPINVFGGSDSQIMMQSIYNDSFEFVVI